MSLSSYAQTLRAFVFSCLGFVRVCLLIIRLCVHLSSQRADDLTSKTCAQERHLAPVARKLVSVNQWLNL